MAGGLSLQPQQFTPPPKLPREQSSRPSSSLQLRTMEDFKQAHAQFVKLGSDVDPRHIGELLSACAHSPWGSVDYALSIFLAIDEPGTFDFNTMIRAFVKSCDPLAALQLYMKMQERSVKPDNFTYPFALKACADLSGIMEGTQVHGHAVKLGFECDVFVRNSLINMYGKCREMKSCCKVFDQMGCSKTVASWSSLLCSHTRMGQWTESLNLFAEMTREGFKPEESSMVSVLSSCAHLGALDLGRSVHCSLLRKINNLNVVVNTSLIEMYTKCGNLEKGLAIFDTMSEKNEWTFSVVISGVGMHGDGERALRIFSNMIEEGVEPNEVIYVGVLSACARSGLLDAGLQFFNQMRFEHGITPTPQHYGCLVDIMCRMGKLSEAYDLIEGMTTEVAWRCLLSACKASGNLELGVIASENLVKVDSQNSGDCMLLSDIYAREGRWDDVARIRTEIFDKKLLQIPGFSRVEVNGMMHTFVSQDKAHPESHRVYEMLHQIEWQLRFEGYDPQQEKKWIINGHSQKLAIAFAMLKTRAGSQIRIFTNLRMHEECHNYVGLVSKIFQREIFVRDRSRFHCFRQGGCSCGHYW